MAREYAKNWFSMWSDEDFCNQPLFDKLFYNVLCGQRAVNAAGVQPINFTRWRKAMRDGDRLPSERDLKASLRRMERRRYVFTDENTGEVLIRSHIRRDELDKQPTVLLSALKFLCAFDSPKFAAVMAAELDRIELPEIKSSKPYAESLRQSLGQFHESARHHLKAISEAFPEGSSEPFADDFGGSMGPSTGGSIGGSARPAEMGPSTGGSTGGSTGPSVSVEVSVDNSPLVATHLSDDGETYESNARDWSSSDDDLPAYIETSSRPTKPQPSSAARTVVRQVLGHAGYPKTTVDRLAVQVQKLARDHPDALIRQALVEWDRRPANTKPEFLPTVLGDLIKASRADPTANGKPINKLRATHDFAQDLRAQEQAQLAATTKELE